VIDAWLLLATGIGAAVLVLVTSWLRGKHEADLGSVSHRWIAEQRMGHRDDSQR
jgi:hypothetical protein